MLLPLRVVLCHGARSDEGIHVRAKRQNSVQRILEHRAAVLWLSERPKDGRPLLSEGSSSPPE